MKIQILGSGCPSCLKLGEIAEEAAKELNINYTMEKVTEYEDMMRFGITVTPALAINDQLQFSGRIPPKEDLKALYNKYMGR